jgi:hypothetical protein
MVNTSIQDEMIKTVENIFSAYDNKRAGLIQGELESLGFVRVGGNPSALSMENKNLELFIILGLDESGSIISHEILRFSDISKK